MPYFKWRGVDMAAQDKQGVMFARSVQELDLQLLEQRIALLSSKPIGWRWQGGRIGRRDIIASLRQLTVLVGTGVLLPDALVLVAEQARHQRLREILHEIADGVDSGRSLSDTMREYPHLFSSILVQLVEVGQESGNLFNVLDASCAHLERIDDFYSRMRSALLLPAITLLFFLLVMSIVFVIIIPYFSDLFASMGHEMPSITRLLVGVSSFFSSRYVLIVIGLFVFGIIGFLLGSRTIRGRYATSAFVLRIWILGPLLRDRFAAYLLHAVALLLEAGIPLARSLEVVRYSTSNALLSEEVKKLESIVSSGGALSEAMRLVGGGYFSGDLIAMVRVGEESGRLACILHKAAGVLHERLLTSLIRLTTLIQPTLMIFLGLLISALVFAVYGPIMTMARVV